MSRFRNTVALTALACLASASGAYAQATVYNQPTDLLGSFASQNDTTVRGFGNYATTFDNFSLGSAASIGKVSWVGDYFTGSPGTITAFTVNFYADNAGQPGGILNTESISGNANETALGTDSFDNPAFSYTATLTRSFAAAAGTPYWLSIVPDLAYPPSWGWEEGTGGDSASYQDYNSFRNSLSSDLAFSLNSVDPSSTPEPGSITMLAGLGLTGLVCLRRRKQMKIAVSVV